MDYKKMVKETRRAERLSNISFYIAIVALFIAIVSALNRFGIL